MAMSAYERGAKLQETEIQMLEKRPEFRERVRVISIVTGAMLFAPVIYAGLLASGKIPAPTTDASTPFGSLWQVLLLIAAVNIVMGFVFIKILSRQMDSATNFIEAAGRSTTAQIVTLAFGEAVTIYGLVTPILGGPDIVAYGLIAAGMLTMLATTAVLKPKIRDTMLRHLRLE